MAASPIQLIVGLGNPGNEYANTRHNAGVWLLEKLADDKRISFRQENKFHGATAKINFNNQECWLLFPTTFMNHSGLAVSALANYYKILPQQILVLHDELDLPLGSVKLKYSGGHGGHNGLRDIIEQLNSNDFWRLRIGIGRPQLGRNSVDYVLEAPNKNDRQMIDESIDQALGVLPLLICGDSEKAMHQLHSKGTK